MWHLYIVTFTALRWLEQNRVHGMIETVGQVQNFSTHFVKMFSTRLSSALLTSKDQNNE